MVRNMFKIIEETTGNVPTRYDLTINEAVQLIEDARQSEPNNINAALYNAITNAFRYGFALGARSERAKERRG